MKNSGSTLKVIEVLEDLTVNYQHLDKKVEEFQDGILRKLQDFRGSLNESYELMNKEAGSFLISGTPEKGVEFEEKHKKLYFDKHFQFEQFYEKIPEKTSKIIVDLQEKVKDLETKLGEEAKKNQKGVYPISENERNLYKKIKNAQIGSDINANTDERLKRMIEYLDDKLDRYNKLSNDYKMAIYLIPISSPEAYNPNYGKASTIYYLYTENVLLNIFPRLKSKMNSFQTYEWYPNLKIWNNITDHIEYISKDLLITDLFDNLDINHFLVNYRLKDY
jgi:hypothetical protein